MTLPVAVVQFFATPVALERNLQTAERLVRAAAASGAQVIVLPELFNIGYVYTPHLSQVAEAEDGPTTQWLTRLSDELQILIGGALLLRVKTSEVFKTSEVYDTFVLVEPGGKSHRYRKQHPFVWEHCFVESGQEPGIVETGLGRIGLLIGWDAAFRSAWAALRGRVDLVLISSAPPRWHRAVLNFPAAKKVYVADLVPEVLASRDEIDDWFLGGLGQGAAWVESPVVSAMMAGRFVSALPLARLSFRMLTAGRPKYHAWAHEANQATLRATFYGSSAVFESSGRVVARVAAEEGWAMAKVSGAVVPNPQDAQRGDDLTAAPDSGAATQPKYWFPGVPSQLDRLETLIKFFSR